MKNLNTHQRYLIEEFADQYHERELSRRDLLIRTLLITGSIPTTAAILTTLGCGGDDDSSATPSKAATQPSTAAPASPTAAATTVVASPSAPASVAAASPSAPASGSAGAAVDAKEVSFKGQAGDVKAYLARPLTATGTLQAVLIIPDNQGLGEHFKDVSRRFAREGFVAMAIDLLSRNGGTASLDSNQAPGLLGGAKPEDLDADLQSGIDYLKTLPGVRTSGLGVTGFCFGGNYTWEIAVLSKDIAAAVPFYGIPRFMDRLGEIRGAVLAYYGATDARVTGTADGVKQKMLAAGKTFDNRTYDGAGHGFFKDGTPSYNEAAAKDAWPRMLDWFRKYLPQA